MSKLVIKGVTKTYGEVKAVNDFSLSVLGGELLTILGPSGCGKSTLLSCVAGIQKPDRGEIFLDGECIFSADRGIEVPPEKREMGFVFQNYALWPFMTVKKNIAYPLTIRKKPRRFIETEIQRFLSLLRLEGKGGSYPYQLSGGEQQRVALGRALIMNPRILILDEPLSNLDARLREEMQDEIKRIQEELKLTIVNVTHDQTEALAISDRILLMNKGSLIQEGRPDSIYRKPNSEFSADFLGTNNLVPGTMMKDFSSRRESGRSADESIDKKLTDSAILSIRPEDIEIYAPGGGGESHGRRAVVVKRIFRGAFIQYSIRDEETTLKVLTPSRTTYEIGSEIRYSIRRYTELPSRR